MPWGHGCTGCWTSAWVSRMRREGQAEQLHERGEDQVAVHELRVVVHAVTARRRRRAHAEAFVAWLTGTASQRALGGGTGRTFSDQHADLIEPAHWQPPTRAVLIDEPDGTAGYDTTTTAEEGFWARKGWAGHS